MEHAEQRVVGAGIDPAHDDLDQDREQEDVDRELDDLRHREHEQGDDRDAVAEQPRDQPQLGELEDDEEDDAGEIDAADGRKRGAHRRQHRLGRLHDELREGVVEVRPGPLEQEPEHDDEDVDPEQGLDQERGRVSDVSAHDPVRPSQTAATDGGRANVVPPVGARSRTGIGERSLTFARPFA